MATFAIGDIQGCFEPLQALLQKIQFDPVKDKLWLTGDIINRGPQSLDVLRFIKNLNHSQIMVLGNHELHFLSVAYGCNVMRKDDTFADILSAPDKDELITWLLKQRMLYVAEGYVMVHAGIAPTWTLAKAESLAQEFESVLQSKDSLLLLKNIYGNEPSVWDDALTGVERWRCIMNFFTRMRFCDVHGRLDLYFKGEIKDKPDNLLPWFAMPNRKTLHEKIIFGHWSALGGITEVANTFALDTGCIWGRCLTAMRLEDGKRFTVAC